MIWRASIRGWADLEPGRQRVFEDERARLIRDVKRFQPQADFLLGNRDATDMLMKLVPDICKCILA